MAVSEAVKERPILFSGDMVRAIMAGRKTQTRRVVKYHEPSFWEHGSATNERSWHPTVVDRGVLWSDGDGHGFTTPIRCPYGKVGDTLWVRETWDHGTCPGDLHGMAGYAADVPVNRRDYRMHPDAPAGSENWCREWKRRPSIHMPRWASRLTLEVTEVRVQRLQEISDEDCKAEGIDDAWLVKAHIPSDGRAYCFRHLWDDINGKKHPWESNPWVWAISFRVKEPHNAAD